MVRIISEDTTSEEVSTPQLARQLPKKVALGDDPVDSDKCCEQSAEFDFRLEKEVAMAIFERIKTAIPRLHENPDGVSQLIQSVEKVHKLYSDLCAKVHKKDRVKRTSMSC